MQKAASKARNSLAPSLPSTVTKVFQLHLYPATNLFLITASDLVIPGTNSNLLGKQFPTAAYPISDKQCSRMSRRIGFIRQLTSNIKPFYEML